MNEALFQHLNEFTKIDEKSFTELIQFFDTWQVNKKEVLLRAGERCHKIFFVNKGCMHMYFIDGKGVEKTVQFAIEKWWLTDFLAFYHQAPSNFYIQAVEASNVLCLSYSNYEKLLGRFPALETYFRKIYQIGYGAALMKMHYHSDHSKEDIYHHFMEHYPEFAQRVPQYLLASFLGFTPEYLSQLRSKKRS
jgi:CRP-like cAMP-binding protein